ncbi:lipoprotein [Clostridia bacterium]|nr:lipoprotein [Clostridia bacterium]
MKSFKKIAVSVFTALSVLSLSACAASSPNTASTENAPAKAPAAKPVTVKIGTTSDEPRIWNAVQSELDKANANIKIELVNLQGGEPNRNLAAGEIDLNSFQHYAYFNKNKEDLGLDLTSIGDTLIVPLSLFSDKHKALDEIPDGGKIAIPDDPTNQGRALNVLKNAGLIEIAPEAGVNGLIKDITSNPKNIDFIEIVAAQIVPALPDVDAAIINCGYATDAGLDPVNGPIYKDEIDLNDPQFQPFINLIAARTADKDNENYKKVVDAYHTKAAADAINEVYKFAALPAFTYDASEE